MSQPPNPHSPLIAWPELESLIPYTRQHILRLEKEGKFPKRVRVGEARIAWVREEVEHWIADRIAARDQHRPGFPAPLPLVEA